MLFLAQSTPTIPLGQEQFSALVQGGAISVLLIVALSVLVYLWRRPASSPVDEALLINSKLMGRSEDLRVKSEERFNTIIDKLTAIQETSTQQRHADHEANIAELQKQTSVIQDQTHVIEVQNLNHNSYQTLVSDNLAAHTTQIDANTATILALKTDMTLRFDHLSEQIEELMKDRSDCVGFKSEWKAFKDEVLGRFPPPVNAIGKTTVTVPEQPLKVDASNLLTDTGAAKAEGEGGGLPLAS